MLSGCAGRQADAPRQPVGARAEAVAPAAALVELTNQVEQACSGGIEMSRSAICSPRRSSSTMCGGVGAKPVAISIGASSIDESAPTVHRDFRRSQTPTVRTIACPSMISRDEVRAGARTTAMRRAGAALRETCRRATDAAAESCQVWNRGYSTALLTHLRVDQRRRIAAPGALERLTERALIRGAVRGDPRAARRARYVPAARVVQR